MNKKEKIILVLITVTFLVACKTSDYSDLHSYMAEVKAQPSGNIEALPSFKVTGIKDYRLSALRSPFDAPVSFVDDLEYTKGLVYVDPPRERHREYLELFELSNLRMVGSVKRDDQLHVLIKDSRGTVHFITEGYYLGKDHGVVVSISDTEIQLIETVASGDKWIERPRKILLDVE